MLINIRLTDIIETGRQYTKNIPLALGISLLFIYEFLTIMPFSFNNVSILSYLLNLINNLNSLILTSNADISSYNVVYNTINTATSQKLVVSPSGTKKLDR
jgi:NADH-ubiquinone oxidoreductase chain 6